MNKTIHYFWFGKGKKNSTIKRCINSWKVFFPDFNIIEWNEDNFDVNCNEYVSEAYHAGKYAFVSDFARFFILEKYGGLYFDTDVEVKRDMHELLKLDAFCGYETDTVVAPGLVLWISKPHNPDMKIMIEKYNQLHFLLENGEINLTTVCTYFTDLLVEKYQLRLDNSKQKCGDFWVYPKDYFCPLDNNTGVVSKSANTYTIHWYAKSWMPKHIVIRSNITRVFHRFFGIDCFTRVKNIWRRSK